MLSQRFAHAYRRNEPQIFSRENKLCLVSKQQSKISNGEKVVRVIHFLTTSDLNYHFGTFLCEAIGFSRKYDVPKNCYIK